MSILPQYVLSLFPLRPPCTLPYLENCGTWCDPQRSLAHRPVNKNAKQRLCLSNALRVYARVWEWKSMLVSYSMQTKPAARMALTLTHQFKQKHATQQHTRSITKRSRGGGGRKRTVFRSPPPEKGDFPGGARARIASQV